MTVQVDGLLKKFGHHGEVIGADYVSFEAKENGITSLLGPSGSGKSTILRLVAGLETPDGGRVILGGKDVTKVPVRERNIGFVFQNYALFNHMTVAENIAFGLSVKKRPKDEIEATVQELLGLVRLQGYGRRLPNQLSGGQRQRVALARALAPNPSVLLLDEPFGALDTKVRIELRDFLHALHEEKQVATLLVTHDQEEALELSDHVVLLNNGRVEQAGSPDDLYEHPATGFVASFLGGALHFKGSVTQGVAALGSHALRTNADFEDGALVDAFVRPHDIRLIRVVPGTLRNEESGVVERIVRVGAFVKVYVGLPDGDSLHVQMQWREFQEAELRQGDRVQLDLNAVRVSQRFEGALESQAEGARV